MTKTLQVALSADFLKPDGELCFQDIGLDVLDRCPTIRRRFFERHEPTMTAAQIRDCDAVIALTPACTRETLAGANRLVVLERFGVGYDMVDVDACTAAGVALCIAAGAVNYSVAESTVAWMLALCHRVPAKDRLLREGRWAERTNHMGSELRDRTLGVVGLGGIGGKLVELLRGFGMKQPVAFDPYAAPAQFEKLGVRAVPLDELMREADFVSVNCPLNAETRNLITKRQLSLMKPDAFLLTTARGGIVNERDLVSVLDEGRIAGAGVDVFESEPVGPGHPLARFENVILAPHSIAWTHELFRDIGRQACANVVAFAEGRIPERYVVNPAVLQNEKFQAKLRRLRGDN